MRTALLLAAASLLTASAAHAADPAGTIEICRVVSAGDRHQGQAITIPQGATFGDAGQSQANGDRIGNYWPLWIATTDKVTIGADGKCATTKARITSNLDKHALRPGDRRWFVPSGTEINKREDWPSDYDVAATVKSDFK